jgi:hypothetical protein
MCIARRSVSHNAPERRATFIIRLPQKRLTISTVAAQGQKDRL